MDNHEADGTRNIQDQFAARREVQQRLITAKEELDGEVDRLDMIQTALEFTQSDLQKLESLSVTGVLSSLFGTKPGKIDTYRQELEALHEQQKSSEQSVQALAEALSKIQAELDAFPALEAEMEEDFSTMVPADGPLAAHDIERALDAAESLLSLMDGAFRVCNRLKNSGSLGPRGGALLNTAMQAWQNKNAGNVMGGLTDAVRHMQKQLTRLNLGPHRLPDVFVLLPRLKPYGESSSLDARADLDAWTELEVITRSIIADLQEESRRNG